MSSMQSSKTILNLKTAVIFGLVGGVLAAAGVYFALHNWSRPSVNTVTDSKIESKFSFRGAAGWWQGATNQTSMAVFDSNKSHACFVSAEYKPGKVDATVEVQKINDLLAKSGGYLVTPIATQTMELKTSTKPLSYDLYQSSVVAPAGAEKVKGGQEFGYVQLPDGHIKVMGYCDTPDQLAATLPVLQAMVFDSAR